MGVDDLLKLPGFDGDTLVCPVGSADSADWKPALAYPPFKKALLEAPAAVSARAPEPTGPSLPSMPPMPSFPPAATLPVPSAFPLPLPEAPAPAARTIACPSCAHANLEEAKFCNACGARMDGAPAPAAKIEPVPAPAAVLPPATFSPPAAAEPDPFAHLDPMLSYPAEPAPMSFSEPPRRPLQPGKMGQLGALEEEAPAPAPAPALAPEPAAETAPAWKRPAVLAAFVGAAVLVGGAAYVVLRKPALPPDTTVAELNPSATPMPTAEPAPAPPPPVVFNTAPPPAPPPIRAPKSKKKAKTKTPQLGAPMSFDAPALSAKPKRARKPRPARVAPPPESETAPGDDTMIESRAEEPKSAPRKKRGKKAAAAGGEDPLLESLLADATQPSGKPAEEAASQPGPEPAAEPERSAPKIGQRPSGNPGKFSLPGLERPVSASDRAPQPAAEEAPAALAEPGKPAPPPGIEDEPAKPAGSDDLALVQVHEQFDFCAQLLAQGAYGDHYDTCLCKDARDAAPYRGRRGFYVSAKKKDSSAGKLDTSAKILSSKLEGGSAVVKARWKNGGADRGHDVSQTWKLEDGLWCQAP